MENVVYGLVNYGNDTISDGAKSSFEYIRDDIADIKKRYIALGYHLSEFDKNEYFKEYGYSNLDEFVLVNFNIDKKALSRILSVYYKFSEPYKIYVSERYSEYSYSQLCEMVSLKDDELKSVTPKMTIREIRDYKKSLKNEKFRDVAKNKEVEQKVLTNQGKCAYTPPLSEPDVQRPFDERYQLTTGRDLFVDILDCLKTNIKNVDKVQAIVKLINGSGL